MYIGTEMGHHLLNMGSYYLKNCGTKKRLFLFLSFFGSVNYNMVAGDSKKMTGTACNRLGWRHLRSPQQLLVEKDGVWDPEKQDTHPSRGPAI